MKYLCRIIIDVKIIFMKYEVEEKRETFKLTDGHVDGGAIKCFYSGIILIFLLLAMFAFVLVFCILPCYLLLFCFRYLTVLPSNLLYLFFFNLFFQKNKKKHKNYNNNIIYKYFNQICTTRCT